MLSSKATPKVAEDGDTRARIITELRLCPVLGNAGAARTFTDGAIASDLIDAVAVIAQAAERAKAGDLSEMETMLAAQAITLNVVFCELARRAALHLEQNLLAAEIVLRLALKAQAQARSTVEALAEIKNPRPAAFVEQANIAQGPQQVNNRIEPGADPRTQRGNFSKPVKRTIGSEQWRTAGVPNGASGKRRKFGIGSRGSPLRGRERQGGRAISALNSEKHGLRGRSFLEEARKLREFIRACKKSSPSGGI